MTLSYFHFDLLRSLWRLMGTKSERVLTQVGVHDEEVEVLLKVAAVFGHFPPQ